MALGRRKRTVLLSVSGAVEGFLESLDEGRSLPRVGRRGGKGGRLTVRRPGSDQWRGATEKGRWGRSVLINGKSGGR